MIRTFAIATATALLLGAAVLPQTATAQSESRNLAEARFDHMSINVADFEGAMAWYQNVLGFEVEVSWRVAALDGKRLAYLVKNDARIELVAADPGADGLAPATSFPEHFGRTGYGHFCFSVEDVDAALAELEAKGVPTFVKAETYALDGTEYERRVGFVQDPEGNVLEFAEPLRRRSSE